ncbi:MAG: PAAR domain-containing protein [Pyrinomonadaceae bacterium]|nr:PAAR domain-containing protein [Pyrinomonadaceae bacterium]
MPPAARITDNVAHPLPPVLTGGPTAITVIIGMLPAWRGIGGPAAAAIQAGNQAATTAITVAETATKAAGATPAAPGLLATEQALKASLLASMSSMISGSGTDIHVCATPSPIPPHGPGVVTTPSTTVMIANMPAARMGDTITEAIGPPNKIVKGEPTVLIG